MEILIKIYPFNINFYGLIILLWLQSVFFCINNTLRFDNAFNRLKTTIWISCESLEYLSLYSSMCLSGLLKNPQNTCSPTYTHSL